MRTCSVCKESLSESDYYACQRYRCKECVKQDQRNRRASNPEQAKRMDAATYARKRSLKSMAKRAERKGWRERIATGRDIDCPHCGLVLPSSEFVVSNRRCSSCRRPQYEQWRARNIDAIREYDRAWKRTQRARNPAKARLTDRNRPEADKARRRKRSIELKRVRLKRDPVFRCECRLRTRLSNAMRGAVKADKTFGLIGCTMRFLRIHLESQFTDGMSWENYGRYGWNVDHIKPCRDFDFTDPEQQRECFHYTNLRPLWWRDNLARNRKYELTEAN